MVVYEKMHEDVLVYMVKEQWTFDIQSGYSPVNRRCMLISRATCMYVLGDDGDDDDDVYIK